MCRCDHEAPEPNAAEQAAEEVMAQKQIFEERARQRDSEAIRMLATAAVLAVAGEGVKPAYIAGRAAMRLLEDLGQLHLPKLPVAEGRREFARVIHEACFNAYWDLPSAPAPRAVHMPRLDEESVANRIAETIPGAALAPGLRRRLA